MAAAAPEPASAAGAAAPTATATASAKRENLRRCCCRFARAKVQQQFVGCCCDRGSRRHQFVNDTADELADGAGASAAKQTASVSAYSSQEMHNSQRRVQHALDFRFRSRHGSCYPLRHHAESAKGLAGVDQWNSGTGVHSSRVRLQKALVDTIHLRASRT